MDDKFWEVVNRYIEKADEIKEETSMPQASWLGKHRFFRGGLTTKPRILKALE